MQANIASGHMGPSDLVWVEGTLQWDAARDIPGLFPKGAEPPVAPAEEIPTVLPVEDDVVQIPVDDDVLIGFECPKCGERMEIKSRMAGRQVSCVECKTLVRVPRPHATRQNQVTDNKRPLLLVADASTAAPPEERRCGQCGHLNPRNMCGHPSSKHYHKRIDTSASCSLFQWNPALAYYEKAIIRCAETGMDESVSLESLETTARLLESAIRMGLPEDVDVQARSFLAGEYRRIVMKNPPAGGNTIESIASNPLLSEAFKQLEYATKVDLQRGYQLFETNADIAFLVRIAVMYQIASRHIRRTRGTDAAISFLEQKLELFRHVRSDPMWDMICELGCLYRERGDEEKAWECFERVVQAEPVRGCEDAYEDAERLARSNLARLARL